MKQHEMLGSQQVKSRVSEVFGGRRPLTLVGVSGGADSVALLRILLMLEIPVVSVHCNFHLRGEESLRDQQFVERLCRDLGVDLEVRQFNETGLESGGSIEDLCRKQRYRAFREIAEKRGCEAIAVAHNADDNVETFMLNLMRGAGIRGLAAMQPDNGEILRPLINVWRSEIIEFLDEIGQDYVTDSSNNESAYNRNFIRNEVLPMLEQRWPAAKKMIARSQENLRNEETILNDITLHDSELSWDVLANSESGDAMVIRWALIHGIRRPVALEMARSAAEKKSGLQWLLPDGRKVVTGRQGIRLVSGNEKAPTTIVGLPEGFTVSECSAMTNRTNAALYIDADITKPPYVWRRPLPGDTMQPLGMRGRQKVAKILKDAGLDIEQRSKTWLLENSATGEIIWIPGLRRSRHELVEGAPHFEVLAPGN